MEAMGPVALAAMERTGQCTTQVQVPSQMAEQEIVFFVVPLGLY